MPNYFITEDFNAPNSIKKDAGGAVYKLFKKGDFIAGTETSYAKKSGEILPVIRTKDFYLVPISKTEMWVADNSESMAALKETKENVDKIVNKSYVEDLVNLSKRSAEFAVAGLVVGFAYGVVQRKNLRWCSVIGAFSFGVAGYAYEKFNQNKNNEKLNTKNGK